MNKVHDFLWLYLCFQCWGMYWNYLRDCQINGIARYGKQGCHIVGFSHNISYHWQWSWFCLLYSGFLAINNHMNIFKSHDKQGCQIYTMLLPGLPDKLLSQASLQLLIQHFKWQLNVYQIRSPHKSARYYLKYKTF